MSDAKLEWLEAIAKHASDAIIVIDKHRIIRYANETARQIAARSGVAGELVGAPYDSILERSRIFNEDGSVPPRESFPTYLALEQGIETRGKLMEQVYDGDHRWLAITAIPIRNEEGEVTHAAVYFSDRSKRKSNEDKLKFVMESSKILSITTDTATRLTQKARLLVPLLADWCTINLADKDGALSRIAIVHRDSTKVPLVEELAARSAKEVSESGIYSVMQTQRPIFTPAIDDTFLKQPNMSPERADLARKLRLCSSMIIPIVSRGESVGILSLAYAESGRHYTQDDFEFMQEFCQRLSIIIDNSQLYSEVEKRDKAREHFLANLSHELRNPLAPIKSHLEILKIKSSEKEYLDEITIIEHQFNHITKLLNDLLDVSRFTLGKIELQPERISLSSLIGDIVKIQEPFIERKNIKFSVSLPPAEVWVLADPTRLEQAIMNVLHNAEKFTPENGTIDIGLQEESNCAVIVVRDNGIGMEENLLKNLFDINASARREHPHGGLGIGLILVSEILRLHGGRIEAHSAGIGRGSEFRIFFPLEEKAEEPVMALIEETQSV